jgi:hypothetical protein
MRGRRAFGGLPIFGTAAAGVVIGHWLSYQVAVPDGHLRHHVLLASGHGGWLVVVKVAVALAIAGAVTLAARFSARRAPAVGGLDALTWLICRLALVQIVAFAGMEAAERIGSGVAVGGMFAHHLFLLGLAVQLLVACAGGVFLLWLSRAARSVAEAARGLPELPVAAVTVLRPVAVAVARPAARRPSGIRGPPRS